MTVLIEPPKRETAVVLYLCIDISQSIGGSRIAEVVRSLPTIVPAIADAYLPFSVKMCIFFFGESTTTITPLTDYRIVSFPDYAPGLGQSTSFADLFASLKAAIDQDTRHLHVDKIDVLRPVVLLFTDGRSTDDDWEVAFRALSDYDRTTTDGFALYPIVVPVAMNRNASVSELKRMACPRYRRRIVIDWHPRDVGRIALKAVLSTEPLDSSVQIQAAMVVPPSIDGFLSTSGLRSYVDSELRDSVDSLGSEDS